MNKGVKDKRIRVLHVISGLEKGGAEKHLLFLLDRLDKNRFSPEVAYLKGKPEFVPLFEKKGIPVHAMDQRSNRGFRGFWNLIRLMRRSRCHIVHTHLFLGDLFGILAAFFCRVPVIISTKHNDDRFWLFAKFRFLVKLTSKMCAGFIAISGHVKKYFVDSGLLPASRIRTIYYGFPSGGRSGRVFRKGRVPLGKKFHLRNTDRIIGAVGRLTEQKGFSFLIRAMKSVSLKFPCAKLFIFGRGEQEQELRSLVRKLGLEKHVFFAGFRPDVERVMPFFEIFVMPSLWEGFGMVLLEAMNAGKPVVASSVSAIPEIVEDRKTGLLVPPADEAALAKAVIALLERKGPAGRMGREGQKRVRTRFALGVMVKKTESLYRELLKSKGLF